MLEELEILRTIVGDLAGASIWLMVSFVAYSLLKIVFTFWAFLWLANKVVVGVFKHIGHDFTKSSFLAMKERVETLDAKKLALEIKSEAKITEIKSSCDEKISKANAQRDKVERMYAAMIEKEGE